MSNLVTIQLVQRFFGTCLPFDFVYSHFLRYMTVRSLISGRGSTCAPLATVNEQLNSMPCPQIITSTQRMQRSSNTVFPTTTRDFSWSHGTQLWIAPPLTKRNHNSDEGGNKQPKIQKRKTTEQITKIEENVYHWLQWKQYF